MKFFREFPDIGKPRVFPVIHAKDEEQAILNAKIAFESGADGIFLINHNSWPVPFHITAEVLMEQIFPAVKSAFPEKWIGLNCLDMDFQTVLRKSPKEVSGLWNDNCGIDSSKARTIKNTMKKSVWRGLYFGGFAFKYQKPISYAYLENLANEARTFVDIITTSGIATGISPDTSKMSKIKAGAGRYPVAIASGITPENAARFAEYAHAFLVATGISNDFYGLSEAKLRWLMREIGR